jgi:hypothetical protein
MNCCHWPASQAGLTVAVTVAESAIPSVSSASVKCPVPVALVSPWDAASMPSDREPRMSVMV